MVTLKRIACIAACLMAFFCCICVLGVNAYADSDDSPKLTMDEMNLDNSTDPTNPSAVDIQAFSIYLSFYEVVYNGNAFEPDVVVVDTSGEALYENEYELEYIDNTEVGQATVKVTGKGMYTGSLEEHFTILPKGTTIKGIKTSSGQVTVTVKQSQDSQYQVAYKASGEEWQYLDILSGTDITINGLKNQKKYSFKVRAYKEISGIAYYSSWSDTKTAIIGISIKDCKIKGVKSRLYNGKSKKPKVKVYYKGKRVKVKVKYGNCKDIGRRYVSVTGTGKIAGTVKKYYYIRPGKVKLTSICSCQWYDNYPSDSEHEYYDSDYNDYVHEFDLKCSKGKGGVSYQFAFKCGSASWDYCSYGKSRAVYWYGFKENRTLRAKVRAYKKVNGEYIVGPWSKILKDTSKFRDITSNYFYANSTYVTGRAKNVRKGNYIRIKFGKRTYTHKVKRNAKKYKFKIRVGHHKTGSKYNVYLLNKYKKSILYESNRVYYRAKIRRGMTKYQVKHLPDWGKPDSTYHSAYGTTWYYDDDSYVYFYKGRVSNWGY